MSLALGIDQSLLHTGICVLRPDGTLIELLLIEPGKVITGVDRLKYIRGKLRAVLAKHDIAVAVMEGYSYNSVGHKFELGELGGMIKLELADVGVPFHVAAPTQLKQFVTSDGGASKDRVMQAILKQWGHDIRDDNLADAFGLASIGREILCPRSRKRHQLSVVKIITNTDLKKEKRKGIKVPVDSI